MHARPRFGKGQGGHGNSEVAGVVEHRRHCHRLALRQRLPRQPTDQLTGHKHRADHTTGEQTDRPALASRRRRLNHPDKQKGRHEEIDVQFHQRPQIERKLAINRPAHPRQQENRQTNIAENRGQILKFAQHENPRERRATLRSDG